MQGLGCVLIHLQNRIKLASHQQNPVERDTMTRSTQTPGGDLNIPWQANKCDLYISKLEIHITASLDFPEPQKIQESTCAQQL